VRADRGGSLIAEARQGQSSTTSALKFLASPRGCQRRSATSLKAQYLQSRGSRAAREAGPGLSANLRAPISGVIQRLQGKTGRVIAAGAALPKVVRNDLTDWPASMCPVFYAYGSPGLPVLFAGTSGRQRPVATGGGQPSVDPPSPQGTPDLVAQGRVS